MSHTESPNVDNENFNRNDQSSFSENNHNEHNYPSHNNNEENFFNNDDNAPLTTTIPTNFGWDQDLTTTTPYFYDGIGFLTDRQKSDLFVSALDDFFFHWHELHIDCTCVNRFFFFVQIPL